MTLLMQYVDGAGVVLVDESAGTEIVIPFGAPLTHALQTLQYFVDQARAQEYARGGETP